MPQDADTQQLLLDVLRELKAVVKDHDKRLRGVELTVAKAIGGVGVLTFLIGIGVAVLARLPK